MLQAERKGPEAAAALAELVGRRQWALDRRRLPYDKAVAFLAQAVLQPGCTPAPVPPPVIETGALLDGFCVPPLSDADQAEALRRSAALLDELGQADGAEKMYRELAARSDRPESQLLLLTFLGRRNRVGEALDLCERAWQTCPPEAVAAASVALLRSEPTNPEHVQRVEARLEAAVGKGPETTALLLSLASLRDLQGRYDEAESLYRRVIAREPDNVQALNNLAFLLAVRGDRTSDAADLINHALDVFGPEAALLDTPGGGRSGGRPSRTRPGRPAAGHCAIPGPLKQLTISPGSAASQG